MTALPGCSRRLRWGFWASASDVFDLHDLEFLHAVGSAHLHDVALLGLEEGLGDRRNPAHVALGEVDLVDAHDLEGALLVPGVRGGDGRAEEYLVGLGALGRVDDLGIGQPLAEITDPAVDLAQPLLAVDIVAVLRAIAVAG